MNGSANPESRGQWNARLDPQSVATEDGLPLPSGLHKLTLEDKRYAYIYIPPNLGRRGKIPLLCMLHGALGKDGGALSAILAFAAAHRLAVIAPRSIDTTWDFLCGGYGPDARFIEYLLAWLMQRHAIDAERIALGGFSDGASYALSLGLKNGDLFTDIMAFSPGFAFPDSKVGQPRIFIAHGTLDAVLPLACSQGIAQTLSQDGYAVHFEPFAEGHIVPARIVEHALTRFLAEHP